MSPEDFLLSKLSQLKMRISNIGYVYFINQFDEICLSYNKKSKYLGIHLNLLSTISRKYNLVFQDIEILSQLVFLKHLNTSIRGIINMREPKINKMEEHFLSLISKTILRIDTYGIVSFIKEDGKYCIMKYYKNRKMLSITNDVFMVYITQFRMSDSDAVSMIKNIMLDHLDMEILSTKKTYSIFTFETEDLLVKAYKRTLDLLSMRE
jgi:hypothetical protein